MADLSACPSLFLTSHPPPDTVSDRIGDTFLHLVVPPELRKNFELDLPKLDEKRSKLVKELEKMNKMMSGENYKVKATPEAQKTHAKKVPIGCLFFVLFFFLICRLRFWGRSWRG